MDRPRLIRGLRIAWSVWWGILCVLLIVMWVRSYYLFDSWRGPISRSTTFHFQSLRGNIDVHRIPDALPLTWGASVPVSTIDSWENASTGATIAFRGPRGYVGTSEPSISRISGHYLDSVF